MLGHGSLYNTQNKLDLEVNHHHHHQQQQDGNASDGNGEGEMGTYTVISGNVDLRIGRTSVTWRGMRSSRVAMPAMAAGKVSWAPTITSTHTTSSGPAHKKVKYGPASSKRRTSLLTRFTTCR